MKVVMYYRRRHSDGSEHEQEEVFSGNNAQIEAFCFIFNNQPIDIRVIRMEGKAETLIQQEESNVISIGQ